MSGNDEPCALPMHRFHPTRQATVNYGELLSF
ncbi:hypothetical protein J2W43_002048 [Pseudomonas brassicacearum]|uniref:Uncharacterized protein n=1 Tax=Pseudomonas brassicacearum TaxID=930166 RepID=A0AAW8M9W3_9PSED|nr:hypothetical protein [Pseudomonas brassicacearum]